MGARVEEATATAQAAVVDEDIPAPLSQDAFDSSRSTDTAALVPRVAAGDSIQARMEPASLLPCLSPLSPIREVHAAGGGDAIAGADASPSNAAETGSPMEANAGLDHPSNDAPRIQGLGGWVLNEICMHSCK